MRGGSERLLFKIKMILSKFFFLLYMFSVEMKMEKGFD